MLLRSIHVLPEPIIFLLQPLNCVSVNLSLHGKLAFFFYELGVLLRQLLLRVLPFLFRLLELCLQIFIRGA
jgi:hypothetical protein